MSEGGSPSFVACTSASRRNGGSFQFSRTGWRFRSTEIEAPKRVAIALGKPDLAKRRRNKVRDGFRYDLRDLLANRQGRDTILSHLASCADPSDRVITWVRVPDRAVRPHNKIYW